MGDCRGQVVVGSGCLIADGGVRSEAVGLLGCGGWQYLSRSKWWGLGSAWWCLRLLIVGCVGREGVFGVARVFNWEKESSCATL